MSFQSPPNFPTAETPAKSYTTRLDPETRDAFEAILDSAKLSEAAGLRLAVLALIEKSKKEGGLKISV